MSILVFPGQGSQSQDLDQIAKDPAIQSILDRSAEILGYNIMELTQEQLQDTSYSQLDTFVKSVAMFEFYKSKSQPVEFVAGHSLGQYAAAVSCGVISFEQGLGLVKERGELMSTCAKETPGAMLACIGMNLVNTIDPLLEGLNEVYYANYNSSQQIVLSGEAKQIDSIADLCKQNGIKCIKLQVAGAFHSPLMTSANDAMNVRIAETEFKDATAGFISARSGEILLKGDKIKAEFVDHIILPVRWTSVMDKIRSIIIPNMHVYEVGPGNVLSKLIKSELDIDVNSVVTL